MIFDRMIERAVQKHVSAAVERHIEAAVDRALTNSPRIQFVKTMQLEMLACDPKMDPRKAWYAAAAALRSYLEDEGCEFGDPRFDWTRDGAVAVIHEYEIHYWEIDNGDR